MVNIAVPIPMPKQPGAPGAYVSLKDIPGATVDVSPTSGLQINIAPPPGGFKPPSGGNGGGTIKLSDLGFTSGRRLAAGRKLAEWIEA